MSSRGRIRCPRQRGHGTAEFVGLVWLVEQTHFGQQHVQALVDRRRLAVLTRYSPLALRQDRIPDQACQQQDAHPFQDNRSHHVHAGLCRASFATALGVSSSGHCVPPCAIALLLPGPKLLSVMNLAWEQILIRRAPGGSSRILRIPRSSTDSTAVLDPTVANGTGLMLSWGLVELLVGNPSSHAAP